MSAKNKNNVTNPEMFVLEKIGGIHHYLFIYYYNSVVKKEIINCHYIPMKMNCKKKKTTSKKLY